MAERSVILRLATKDGEVVKRALMTLGKEGEDALKRIERAGAPASRGIAAVDAAAKEARQSIEGLASRAGAGGNALRAFGPAGLAAAAGLGAIVIGLGAVMAKAHEAVDYFDDLQDAAQRLGVSTEFLQALRFAVGQSGGDIEKTEIALDRLNAVMGDIARGGGGEAAKAFKLLGVSATDAQGRVKSLERALAGTGRWLCQAQKRAGTSLGGERYFRARQSGLCPSAWPMAPTASNGRSGLPAKWARWSMPNWCARVLMPRTSSKPWRWSSSRSSTRR